MRQKHYKNVEWDVLKKTAILSELTKRLEKFTMLEIDDKNIVEDQSKTDEYKRTQTEILNSKINEHNKSNF